MKKLVLKSIEYQQLEKAFESWLKALGYSASSCYNLPIGVREFLHYQEQYNRAVGDWKGLDFIDFMRYYQERKNERRAGGLSNNQINKMAHALDLLQVYLKKVKRIHFYQKLGRLNSNSEELRILDEGQIKALYAACQPNAYGARNKAILGLCYGCGLRRSEAANLDKSDIWWEKSLLQVRKSKTKKSRIIPMTVSYTHLTLPTIYSV